MTVGPARTVTPAAAPPSSPAVVGMSGFPAGGEFAGNVADDLDKFLGHPTDGGQNLA